MHFEHGDGFKVLLDLSYATLGYCGLAQESRLLLRSLYEQDGVHPTGLIFGRGGAVVTHRFSRGVSQDRQMENQALFLEALASNGTPQSRFRPIRWLQRFHYNFRLAMGRVQTATLDSEFYWDAVWRNVLAKSLPDDDREVAMRCPMLLANLGGTMLAVRSVYNLPAPRIDTRGFEFAVFHDSQAIRVSPGTCKLIRYQDLIPGLRPDLVGNRTCVQNHFRAIRRCLHDSIYVCSSEPTRSDLLRTFPELEERCVVIPDIVLEGYYPQRQPQMIPSIIRNRHSKLAGTGQWRVFDEADEPKPYLIMVSTIEPRKNHVSLIRAYEQLLSRHDSELRLVIVGNAGWKYTEAVQAMQPLVAAGKLFHLENVPLNELRVLYTHAEALVFPSYYEGFGYPPLEAMCCGAPTAVSDIATHRWVYGDAAVYFDPYRLDSLVECLEELLFCGAEQRQQLVDRGRRWAARYFSKQVGRQWFALFEELRRQHVRENVRNAKLSSFKLCDKALTSPHHDAAVSQAA
jgi:glycosyltransferase involved in cell wall biosynthesis